MHSVLLIIHILVSAGVIALVLLQHGRGADAGAAFGGGASGSVFGSRGPTTFLTRMTTILVTVFFLTSLSLAWLAGDRVERRSVVERVQTLPEDDLVAEPDAVRDDGGAVPSLPEMPALGSPDTEAPPTEQ